MRIVIEMELEVKIPEDRANVNEIFMAVQTAMAEARSQAATKAIEGYEEQIIQTLCSASGRQAKKGLGPTRRRGTTGSVVGIERSVAPVGGWMSERFTVATASL